MRKQLDDKHKLSEEDYIKVLEKSVEVLIYMRKQDLSVRDFLMDKSMELITKMEMVKKINSNLSKIYDAPGFWTAIANATINIPTHRSLRSCVTNRYMNIFRTCDT